MANGARGWSVASVKVMLMRPKDRKRREMSPLVKSALMAVLLAEDRLLAKRGEMKIDGEKYRIECRWGRCRLVRI